MALSMTGYGSGDAALEGRAMTVELHAVNHRYLDLAFRTPKCLGFAEDALRGQIQAALSRGHVDIYVAYKNTRTDQKSVVCDFSLAQAYVSAAKTLSGRIGLKNNLDVKNLLRLPGVVSEEDAEEDRDALLALAQKAMAGALDALIAMRQKEGAHLCADLSARGRTLLSMAEAIEARVPMVEKEARERLKKRTDELLADAALEPGRLEQEVVLLVERAGITEELVRLASHLSQMEALLESPEPIGRRLDFLVQEMNREVNTIGSKSSDIEILNLVVRAKSEIEKIREQVQNLE